MPLWLCCDTGRLSSSNGFFVLRFLLAEAGLFSLFPVEAAVLWAPFWPPFGAALFKAPLLEAAAAAVEPEDLFFLLLPADATVK